MMNSRKFWQFRNSAEGDSAELLFYGPIAEESWWGDEVTPRQFADDLKALGNVGSIRVRMHSPGGDVFAAHAIHSQLKAHPAKVTVYIDGLAASAASVVAMAGDTVIMPRNAMMMIHNPWTITWGDARDLRSMADVLDKVRDSIIAAYEAKTGLDRNRLIGLLNSETWMTAAEAKDLGFADEIDEPINVSASIRGGAYIVNGVGFDLAKFKTIPASFLAGKEVIENMAKVKAQEEEILETPEAGEAEETPEAPEAEIDAQAQAEEPVEGEAEESSEQEAAADPIAQAKAEERARIQALQALARPGAEQIIADAIESGADPRDVALAICQSDSVRNAERMDARRRDVRGVAPGNAQTPEASTRERSTGLLASAMRKLRGLPEQV